MYITSSEHVPSMCASTYTETAGLDIPGCFDAAIDDRFAPGPILDCALHDYPRIFSTAPDVVVCDRVIAHKFKCSPGSLLPALMSILQERTIAP